MLLRQALLAIFDPSQRDLELSATEKVALGHLRAQVSAFGEDMNLKTLAVLLGAKGHAKASRLVTGVIAKVRKRWRLNTKNIGLEAVVDLIILRYCESVCANDNAREGDDS
ncbi:MAG: hypothetical protein Q8S73_33180 [Deltaproteobacteria bacterium]|nr:hypothetical protein [Deltaproteobacteria bacterium]